MHSLQSSLDAVQIASSALVGLQLLSQLMQAESQIPDVTSQWSNSRKSVEYMNITWVLAIRQRLRSAQLLTVCLPQRVNRSWMNRTMSGSTELHSCEWMNGWMTWRMNEWHEWKHDSCMNDIHRMNDPKEISALTRVLICFWRVPNQAGMTQRTENQLFNGNWWHFLGSSWIFMNMSYHRSISVLI